jgi:hypothetical protein
MTKPYTTVTGPSGPYGNPTYAPYNYAEDHYYYPAKRAVATSTDVLIDIDDLAIPGETPSTCGSNYDSEQVVELSCCYCQAPMDAQIMTKGDTEFSDLQKRNVGLHIVKVLSKYCDCPIPMFTMANE